MNSKWTSAVPLW